MAGKDFSLYTLVDITETGVLSNTISKSRNQQRNLQTVIQTLSLRTQPIITFAHNEIVNLNEFSKFGSDYRGEQRVWMFKFSVDYQDIFISGDGNPVGLLEQDFNEIPVINGLDETARFILPCFFTQGVLKNIYFNEGP